VISQRNTRATIELLWRHVRERTLLVFAPKTGRRRTFRLFEALADDLGVWRAAQRDRDDELPVFPDESGAIWTANGFEKWRQRRFNPLRAAAGLTSGRPYDLRHSFASLLLHEGRDVIYVARQLRRRSDAAHVRARDRGAGGLAAAAR
jgi:integrase